MKGRRTALIVVVPEAEAAVSQIRTVLDPMARLGVPAHVTVLFPFVPAPQIDDDLVRRLGHMFAESPVFEHRLVRTGWFGEEVLWLAPDAEERFRVLTDLTWRQFPDYPPYQGQFDDVVPHLTIADHGPLEAMRRAERQVQRHLPIPALTQRVTLLIEQANGRWQPATVFALRDPTRAEDPPP